MLKGRAIMGLSQGTANSVSDVPEVPDSTTVEELEDQMVEQLWRVIHDLDATSHEQIEKASNEPRHIKNRRRENLIGAGAGKVDSAP
jgi:hypothetical protein